METQPAIHEETVQMTEAPYSANFRARDAQTGFEIQFTVRAVTEDAFFARLSRILDRLTEQGYLAAGGRRESAAESLPALAREPAPAPPAASAAESEARPDWCSIHNVQMRRHEKDGEVWYSHRTEEGTWCKGK